MGNSEYANRGCNAANKKLKGVGRWRIGAEAGIWPRSKPTIRLWSILPREKPDSSASPQNDRENAEH